MGQPPPSYQEVMNGRIDSHIVKGSTQGPDTSENETSEVDAEMSPLEYSNKKCAVAAECIEEEPIERPPSPNRPSPTQRSQQQLPKQQQQQPGQQPQQRNITIVVPFIPGIGEKFKKLCKAKGIQVHYKVTNTLRTMLGNPKDKDPKSNNSWVIYHYKCPHINCPDAYIGESGRTLGECVKEHLKVPFSIHQHSITKGHPLDPEQFTLYTRKFTVILGP